MQRYLMSFATVALGLAVSGSAQACGGGSSYTYQQDYSPRYSAPRVYYPPMAYTHERHVEDDKPQFEEEHLHQRSYQPKGIEKPVDTDQSVDQRRFSTKIDRKPVESDKHLSFEKPANGDKRDFHDKVVTKPVDSDKHLSFEKSVDNDKRDFQGPHSFSHEEKPQYDDKQEHLEKTVYVEKAAAGNIGKGPQ